MGEYSLVVLQYHRIRHIGFVSWLIHIDQRSNHRVPSLLTFRHPAE